MTSFSPSQACICGHLAEAHEHYRRGSDCAMCQSTPCSLFRPRSGPRSSSGGTGGTGGTAGPMIAAEPSGDSIPTQPGPGRTG